MKPLPDKKAVWIMGFICVVPLMLLTWSGYVFRGFKGTSWYDLFNGVGRTRGWLELVPLFLSYFVAFLYFIPVIKTLKRAVVYSLIIPLFCCLMTHTTFAIVIDLLRLDFPFYLKEKSWVGIVYRLIVDDWLFFPYILLFSLPFSPFLVLAFGLYLRASKRTQQSPEAQETVSISPFQRIVMEMRLFRHKRLTFGMILIYFVFLLVYCKLYQLFWFEDTPAYRTYGFFSYVYILSFFSLFILAPIMIGQIKRTLAFCALAPLFWSVAIFTLLLVMALLFSEDRFIIINKLFSTQFLTHFFLDRYLKTQAWLIGLPLLLVCYIYARLARSELARRIEQRET